MILRGHPTVIDDQSQCSPSHAKWIELTCCSGGTELTWKVRNEAEILNLRVFGICTAGATSTNCPREVPRESHQGKGNLCASVCWVDLAMPGVRNGGRLLSHVAQGSLAPDSVRNWTKAPLGKEAFCKVWTDGTDTALTFLQGLGHWTDPLEGRSWVLSKRGGWDLLKSTLACSLLDPLYLMLSSTAGWKQNHILPLVTDWILINDAWNAYRQRLEIVNVII